MSSALQINIYGSAGVGKTTLAEKLVRYITIYLRRPKICSEKPVVLVKEFATELIQKGKFDDLKNQILVTKGQIKYLKEGFANTDIVICESPLKLGLIYSNKEMLEEVKGLIKNNENLNSIDLFIKHDEETKKTYTMQGRVHTLEESQEKEAELLHYLDIKKLIFVNRNDSLEKIFSQILQTKQWKSFEFSKRIEFKQKQDKDNLIIGLNSLFKDIFISEEPICLGLNNNLDSIFIEKSVKQQIELIIFKYEMTMQKTKEKTILRKLKLGKEETEFFRIARKFFALNSHYLECSQYEVNYILTKIMTFIEPYTVDTLVFSKLYDKSM